MQIKVNLFISKEERDEKLIHNKYLIDHLTHLNKNVLK